MSPQLIVIGSGGHAAVIVDALLASGATVLGLTDADAARHGTVVCGRPVLGDDATLAKYDAGEVRLANGIGSVGSCAARRAVQARLEGAGWIFDTVRHPSAVISGFARIDRGAQLLAGSVVQPRAHVSTGCIVNTCAVVEHDVTLGVFTHVAPGAIVCGDVHIGAGCHIGAGAVIRQGTTLGDEIVVAAGAVVVRDHSAGGLLLGVPARAQQGKP
jgi:sugar O-acyltransferase (sialic acid O-acetyltransferase NeuD family)